MEITLTARQLDPACGCDWAVNAQPEGGTPLMFTSDPEEKPSAVMVTWPGALTLWGLTERPGLLQNPCALATSLRPGITPPTDSACNRTAKIKTAAQNVQGRGMLVRDMAWPPGGKQVQRAEGY